MIHYCMSRERCQSTTSACSLYFSAWPGKFACMARQVRLHGCILDPGTVDEESSSQCCRECNSPTHTLSRTGGMHGKKIIILISIAR